ncbi:uncharacterized protein MYCFIDRAFT_211818 [Pseudocercospora fijiensis CIRAD86]|uniref:Uncharacterized protein n=1 Tax=Pseudocercospora fijiensis (strain CIRAD86) TaxID=383855 RepID=M2YUE7_PSEFD|nr:uncharacterized protein MYCFIDRAFT_211818 [Pseudocercospora fijiensis CIRAD86]EME81350.1 hypothetical protein MYCFIDRAFT_211818 [Pseudocercospora fijiensis CIRAD86]
MISQSDHPHNYCECGRAPHDRRCYDSVSYVSFGNWDTMRGMGTRNLTFWRGVARTSPTDG